MQAAHGERSRAPRIKLLGVPRLTVSPPSPAPASRALILPVLFNPKWSPRSPPPTTSPTPWRPRARRSPLPVVPLPPPRPSPRSAASSTRRRRGYVYWRLSFVLRFLASFEVDRCSFSCLRWCGWVLLVIIFFVFSISRRNSGVFKCEHPVSMEGYDYTA
jgi:hypothetical protein